ncbi:MAG: FAD-dependent monooxygenase [Alphaproteobacteria bacterium]|nr:FAD-dependent monooxygenase [Alphaproteobacteria bacterium]
MAGCSPIGDAHELVIVGGGHSGLLLALALDHYGLRPTVIDAEPVNQVLEAPFDGRALALMQGSKQVFAALGLWPDFAPIATRIDGVQVSDDGTGGSIAYDAREVGGEAFGYGIETRLLRQRLLRLVLDKPAIHHLAPHRLAALERDARGLTLVLDDGRSLETPLAIGADGRRSTLRRLANIGVERIDYRQTALTFAFRHAEPHEHRVREFMGEAGPLALLPIGESLCSATWIERPDVADRLMSASSGELLEALSARQKGALSPLEILGKPAAFPLSAETAQKYAAPRIALAGDAAHGLHPIHAQGWNLGVRDIAALAEVLVDAASAGLDLGSGEVLQRYARWRDSDLRLILGLTDGLNRLFSSDFASAKLIRRTGLAVLDNLAPVKSWVMRRGMGIEGDLPKLARGLPLQGAGAARACTKPA